MELLESQITSFPIFPGHKGSRNDLSKNNLNLVIFSEINQKIPAQINFQEYHADYNTTIVLKV